MHVQDRKKIKIHLNLLFLLVTPILLRMQLASTQSSKNCDCRMGSDAFKAVWLLVPPPEGRRGNGRWVLILSSEAVSLQISLIAPKAQNLQTSTLQRSQEPPSPCNSVERIKLIWLQFF